MRELFNSNLVHPTCNGLVPIRSWNLLVVLSPITTEIVCRKIVAAFLCLVTVVTTLICYPFVELEKEVLNKRSSTQISYNVSIHIFVLGRDLIEFSLVVRYTNIRLVFDHDLA